ncbi:MAG: diaminopimelate epimerase [Muribaculaceae bacterium]|nr:diaminopimelate epimerase [Muribaculaceae bacterium]
MANSAGEIKFTKMHGVGNDYVYVDTLQTPHLTDKEITELAISISDRHFGVGGDGLVLIMTSDIADFRMRMFNSDGSEAQMCGNASRCVGKYVYDHNMTRKTCISLETKAGIKTLHLNLDGRDKVQTVRVDMGEPELNPSKIPVDSHFIIPDPKVIKVRMQHDDKVFYAVAVNIGNPHSVIFIDESPTDYHIHEVGKKFEVHPAWPEKVNVEFARITDRHTIEMRVWERGSGETLACGTGACATVVAGILLGLLDREVKVILLGGELFIKWCHEDNHVYMTGPAITVASGIYYMESSASRPPTKYQNTKKSVTK